MLRDYESCRNQVETYQQNIGLIDNSLQELRVVNKSLEEIKGTKKNSEVFVPIGMDSFIKAKITDSANVIVGIGTGIAVKKNIEDAKKDVEDRITELEKVKADNTSNLEQVISKLRELEPSVQSIMSQATKKEG